MAKQKNDMGIHFPIWGTCLGFESLLLLLSNFETTLHTDIDNINIVQSIKFDTKIKSMFTSVFSEQDFSILQTFELMYLNHNWGFKMENINQDKFVKQKIDILATFVTSHGVEVLGAFKDKAYPFYGVQYHPELTQFVYLEIFKINKEYIATEIAQKHALVIRNIIGDVESYLTNAEVIGYQTKGICFVATMEMTQKTYFMKQSK
jgi:gamma-glutamyl hydrolase